MMSCRSAALLCLFLLGSLSAAAAGERLGTHRTLSLSPADHDFLMGYEPSLGLRDKEVVLSFDDGPLGATRTVLATLRRHGTKATFFLVGRQAANHPRSVRAIRADGHTVAHHSWNHERLPTLGAAAQERSIDRGIAAVEKAAYGAKADNTMVPFFRAPYLALDATTRNILRRRGLISIGANIDSLDWKQQTSSALHDRIMKRLRAKRKGILLLHDIHPRTAAMLPRLLNSMAREGFKIVHMVPSGGTRPEAPTVLASLDADAAAADDAGSTRETILQLASVDTRRDVKSRAKQSTALKERVRAKKRSSRKKSKAAGGKKAKRASAKSRKRIAGAGLRKSKSHRTKRRTRVKVKRVARRKLRAQFIFN